MLISPGVIATFAGTGAWGNSGDNGPAASGMLGNPEGVAIDAAGNLYIADSLDDVVRQVNTTTGVITTVAGNGQAGYSGDNGPATSATLNAPTAVAVDAAGNLYIADNNNNCVRRVDAFSGKIATVAGVCTATPASTLGDGGPASSASLDGPSDVAVDAAGNLYIADMHHHRVRKVDSSGTITTIAGGGTPGPGSDGIGNGGPAVNAVLGYPSGLALDAAGNLYIADSSLQLVRVIKSGIISVVAGNGSAAYSGDGGTATNASLYGPAGIRVDAAGDLFIADTGNSVVREVNAAGIITTIAGNAAQFGYFGDGGSAARSVLNAPTGVAVNASGNVYIADSGNRVVRSVGATAAPLSFAGTTVGTVSSAQIVTLQNVGNQPLAISNVAVSGNFVQQSSGATDCVVSLNVAPGASCSIAVAFAPQTNGSLTGTVTLGASSGNVSVALTGTGSGSAASLPAVSATALTFSNQVVGIPSGVQTLTLSNPGPAAISIAGISLSGSADFAIGSTTCGSTLAANSSCTVSIVFTPSAPGTETATLGFNEFVSGATGTVFEQSVLLSGTTPPLEFVPITPCRIADTRNASGPFGGPAISGQTSRDFVIPNSGCNIPSTAAAYALNVTVVPHGGLGYLTVWPAGQSRPLVSTLNSDGRVKANAAIIPGGVNGAISVYVSNTTDLVLDISGYFVPKGTPGGLAFFPLTPCRIADTRRPTGDLGGPWLMANQSRSFPILSSSCNVPREAQAYSLNFTAVPHGWIGYLSTWPTGQSQPLVSTLNAPTGTVTANAAIVRAGADTEGSISVFSSNDTDLVIDINGYFAPAGPGGLSLFTVKPCRVLDTRELNGSQPFNGTATIDVVGSGCGVSASAQAYVFNATVVPAPTLGYLALWSTGEAQPLVSTLNA
ncbi:MAG: choice-of-anchor D domain-containing protein, partial [Acidobacteriaceae bacterium]|nr:choice-of-anchor D domain-containing protein [Acidobacteriaceae bacterium]